MIENYIYLRDQNHKYVYKLGGSCDIVNRGCTYITGEYEKCQFIKIWKIDKPWRNIEHDIQEIKFKNLNSYKGSGTEYFFKEIVDKIEPYFEKNNIDYEIVDINSVERQIYEKIKLNKIQNQLENLKISELKCKITPYEYQEEDKLKAIEYFKSNDIGHILWSCGLGKTYESLFIWHALDFKSLLICVPSLYLKSQFCCAIRNVFGRIKICDNFENIDEYLKSDQPYKIIISTYHSCYKMLKYDYILDMKIGDECHHLVNSQNDDIKSFTDFHKIRSKKTLFMTATSKELEDNCEYIYTMSNEEQFGKLISERSVKWAIENKKITDYNICCIKNNDLDISQILSHNEIECFKIKTNINELFLSAYSALKSIENGYGTHLLVYANNCDSAYIIKKLINILINKNIFNIDENELYNQELYSKKDTYHTKNTLNDCEYCDKQNKCILKYKQNNDEIDHDCTKDTCKFKCQKYINIFHKANESIPCEICKFTKSKYGIISCVYIFGEGFDLPKLNAVVIGEKMSSDIRIVQSCLRPNRNDINQPNKKASIIIPYNPDLDDDNDKLQRVIKKIGNCDNCIEQKISLVEIHNSKKEDSDYYNNSIILKENKDELLKLKLNLYTRSYFNTIPKWYDIYNRHKEYNKGKFMSVKNYKENPDKHIVIKPHFPSEIWKGWYDYLNIECSNFIQTKYEWIKYCNKNNITSVDEYYEIQKNDNKLCLEPIYYYKDDFTTIYNELKLNKNNNYNYKFRN